MANKHKKRKKTFRELTGKKLHFSGPTQFQSMLFGGQEYTYKAVPGVSF